MITSRSVIVGEELPKGWTELLAAWFDELDHFVAVSNSRTAPDLPYWYNEGANVGFLIAAVSKLGGTAIQEYAVDKVNGSKGRCDLWICLPQFDMELGIEAKFSYNATSSTVEKLTDVAGQQIRTYSPDKRKSCPYMTLVFIAPYNSSEGQARKIFDEMYQWVSSDQWLKPHSICAAYQPPIGTGVSHRYERDGVLYYYPGLIVAGRLCQPKVPSGGSGALLDGTC